MVITPLHGFEEFQNTEEGRKVHGHGRISSSEPFLKFRKINYKNRTDVAIILNRPLLRMMKDNGVLTFKLLFNEKTGQVAIKYDTSSSAKTLVNKRTRVNGDILFTDKFVTATILPLMKDKNLILYKVKSVVDKIIFILNKSN